MSADSDAVSAYRLLGVHPAAPNDLLNAAYWRTASELQRRRTDDESVDATLYAITRSYELIANPEARAAYDASIGLSVTPVMVRPLSQIRRSWLARLLRKAIADSSFDCYEMIGLDSSAPDRLLPEAYKIMRDHYLRAPDSRRRAHLLSALDEAYTVLSDEDRRRRYDAQRLKRTDGSVSNSRRQHADPMPTPSPQAIDKTPQAIAPDPPSDALNVQTDGRSRISLNRAVASTRRGVVATWHAVKGGTAGALGLPSRLGSTGPKKDSDTKSVDLKPLRRPASRKKADVEEVFLGRLATRVGQGEPPEDLHSGD